MEIHTKVCQKVSMAHDQKVLRRGDENIQRLEKISFRKDQDFTLNTESI